MNKIPDKTDKIFFIVDSILWIKDNVDTIQASFKTEFPQLRSEAVIENIHRKLPEQVAYLQFSFNILLKWAHEKGAIDDKERKLLSQYGWVVFCKVAKKHGERIQQDDPVILFFDVLRSLLVQGKVRVDHKDMGYESFFGGQSGELIGWYDDEFYYLMPVVAWHTLNTFLRLEGGYFPFSKTTLYNTLGKRGYIQGGSDGRHAIPVRIKGELRKVLKVYKKNKILEVCKNGAEDDSL